ncbi:unnamed protein product [Albugo candida]|uniref:Uncharacterized protein n=1 Tax=Albugo candida TaxID=65357 RepID=A0A024FX06_9STRA|nr:unnamed protein product [Albugo candida]|eukprot:CCI11442.1 unnamed protein product [Albugo candida]
METTNIKQNQFCHHQRTQHLKQCLLHSLQQEQLMLRTSCGLPRHYHRVLRSAALDSIAMYNWVLSLRLSFEADGETKVLTDFLIVCSCEFWRKPKCFSECIWSLIT